MKKFRLGLVLGGGGARGLAHIGVLKVLHKEGIIPDYVIGTSIGALVGAWYATTLNPEKVEEEARKFLIIKEFKEIQSTLSGNEFENVNTKLLNKFFNGVRQFFVFNIGFIRNSVIPGDLVKTVIDKTISVNNFSDLKIPFACVGTDLTKGEKVVFETGDLKKAILITVSIPGVFPPVKKDNRYFCDGATVGYTPVQIAKEKKLDYILAVEVKNNLHVVEKFSKGIDVIFRSQDIGLEKLHQEELKFADFVLHPDIKNIHWANFKKIDICIKKGEEEALKYINKIKNIIQKKRFLNYFKIY